MNWDDLLSFLELIAMVVAIGLGIEFLLTGRFPWQRNEDE